MEHRPPAADDTQGATAGVQAQVLLRMKASSLNFRDTYVIVRGYGSFTGNLPLVPILDGVGEVVEIGTGSPV